MLRTIKQVQIRKLEDSPEESTIDEAAVRRIIIKEVAPQKKNIDVGKLGHVQRHCKRDHSTSSAIQANDFLQIALRQASGFQFSGAAISGG